MGAAGSLEVRPEGPVDAAAGPCSRPARPRAPLHAPDRRPLAGLRGVLLFHANLLYSSIEVEQRPEVLRRCYRPLLGLLDCRPWLDLALEASGHTLELAASLDPDWLVRLRQRIDEGRVELVGSGDTQLIGPLVPERVHRANQELGIERYATLLGQRPRTALVNEGAWSQGLIDGYLDAGYELLLAEWNNPRRRHPEWPEAQRWRLARSRSPRGREIDLAWIDTTAFQQMQRTVHGELEPEEYLRWLRLRCSGEERLLFLYASDAEVFDFRPGRYATEAPHSGASEWHRLGALLDRMNAEGLAFELPERARKRPALAARRVLTLTSLADPVPVKKQPKYNVTRWALSGHDDPGLNAACFARHAELSERPAGAAREEWRELCRAWASDLRTHLTPARWSAVAGRIQSDLPERRQPSARTPPSVRVEGRGRRLLVASSGIEVVLDPRRGLAIESLRARVCGSEPILGTLPHGTFDAIELTADFYSGHTVLDVPGRGRVTDLERCEPEVSVAGGDLVVRALVPTPHGPLEKRVSIGADQVAIFTGLSALGERPPGSLRTAFLTWRPEALETDPWIECSQGGAPERFRVCEEVDHGAAISPLVSAGGAFGASDGRMGIETGEWALDLEWDVTRCPALPMLSCRRVSQQRFMRLAFSVCELDETHRPGARLRDFELVIRPRRPA